MIVVPVAMVGAVGVVIAELIAVKFVYDGLKRGRRKQQPKKDLRFEPEARRVPVVVEGQCLQVNP